MIWQPELRAPVRHKASGEVRTVVELDAFENRFGITARLEPPIGLQRWFDTRALEPAEPGPPVPDLRATVAATEAEARS